MGGLALGTLLELRATQGRDRPAVIDPDGEYSYGQLHFAVSRAAASLSELGVAEGDRVAHLGLTCYAHTVLLFATAQLGALYVPLDAWLMPAALDPLVKAVEPKVVLLGKSLMQRPIAEDLKRSAWKLPESVHVVDLFSPDWQAILQRPGGRVDAVRPPAADRPTSPCLLLFSSGTTGKPKGIVFTQEALVVQALVINLGLAIGPDEQYLNVYQASHYGGITCSVQTVAAGACLVNVPLPFPDAVLQAIEKHRVSFVVAVPNVWRSVLAHPAAAKTDFSSLRMANAASDFIPPDLIRQITETTGAVSVQGYGLSECGLVTLLPAADARPRVGSAGVSLPLAGIRIRREDGAPALPGEEGEIWVKTAYAAAGVWIDGGVEPLNWDEEGFLNSGDVGYVEGDGHLHVTGRGEDFMKVSGYRVSPAEVEAVLMRHPLVKDAAVFGVKHETLGQAPVAVVVAKQQPGPTVRELAARVAVELMPQAVPVAFVAASRIDRTESTGKVRRRKLRERFERGEYSPLPG